MVRAAALVIVLSVLSGCNRHNENPDMLETYQLRSELHLMKGRIAALEDEMSERRTAQDVVLKRGDEGYSFARSDVGGITVKLKGVSDTGGVAWAKMEIGNATSAKITTTQIAATWGPVDKDGKPESGKGHFISPVIKKDLAPGSWTEVSFPIDGAKASDVGFIRVHNVLANSITLTS